jgi:hypothetical protein
VSSSLEAESYSHWWYVYSPADLAAVAAGVKRQDEIQASSTWQVQYPSDVIDYDSRGYLPHWRDLPPHLIIGATFDEVTSTLFVAVRFGWHGVYAGEAGHVVYAYRAR